MKRIMAPTTLIAGLATVFLVGISASADAGDRRGCSAASLQGGFGFTSVGNLLAFPPPIAGPFAEIGRQTFDGEGNTEGTATLSANGNILRVTVVGTYAVNADCTGTMTLNVAPIGGDPVELDFVIDDDGNELRAIVTGAGVVESREYRKQSPKDHKD